MKKRNLRQRKPKRRKPKIQQKSSQAKAIQSTTHSPSGLSLSATCPCGRGLPYRQCCFERDQRTSKYAQLKYVAVRLGTSHLGWPEGTIEGVKSKIRQLRRDDFLLQLQRLAVVISNSPVSQETDIKLSQQYYSLLLRNRVDEWRREHNKERVALFSDQQVFLLTYLAQADDLVYQDPPVPDERAIQLLPEILLEANDILAWCEEAETMPDILNGMEKQLIFNNNDQMRYMIPRGLLTYLYLPRKEKHKKSANYVDLNKLIESQYGFDIDTYFETLLFAWSNWSQHSIDDWTPANALMDPKTVFSNLKDPQRHANVLVAFADKPSQRYPGLNASLPPNERMKLIYEFFDIKKRPLMWIGERLACMSLDCVIELFWHGIYYLVLDYPSSTKEFKDRYLRFLGELHEDYCQCLGRWGFGEKFTTPNTPAGFPLNDGVVEIASDWIFVLEMKSARVNTEMVSGAQPLSETKAFGQRLAKGIDELSRRTAEIRKGGYTGRITPCIVLSGFFPQSIELWQRYNAKLNDLAKSARLSVSILQDTKADFPLVIDIEEWEMLTALVSSGYDIRKILNGRLERTDLCQGSLSNYFYEKIGRQGGVPNAVLISLFEGFFKQIKTRFRESASSYQVEDSLWQRVFKLEK